MQQFQQAALARYRNENLPADDRRDASGKLADIHEIRALIGAPLHLNSAGDPRRVEIIRRNPVGTPLYIIDSSGVRVGSVTQQMKDRILQQGQ